MSSKHTPGPWLVANTHDAYAVRGDDGMRPIAYIEPSEITFAGKEVTTPEDKANARLIAAAPELLAALEDLLAPYNMAEEYQAKIAHARAAIAKAKEDSK